MASYGGDQASGLRRLFGRKATRVVAFVAGGAGVGKSVLVANLAASLARQGREVLVIDENTRRNVASCFGVVARHDLWQAIDREKSLAEVLLTAAPGVRILPAASAVGELGKLDQAQQASLLEILTGIERVPDVILVDASADHPLGFSPLGLAAHDAVVVMSGSGPSITDAYALVKKVSLAYARRNFRVILNKVRGGDEAASIHANMAQLTRSRGFVISNTPASCRSTNRYSTQPGSASRWSTFSPMRRQRKPIARSPANFLAGRFPLSGAMEFPVPGIVHSPKETTAGSNSLCDNCYT